jgi:hypothetical protein
MRTKWRRTMSRRELQKLAAHGRGLKGQAFERFVSELLKAGANHRDARRLVTRVNLEDALNALGGGRRRALGRAIRVQVRAEAFERKSVRERARRWVEAQNQPLGRLRMLLRQHRVARGDV